MSGNFNIRAVERGSKLVVVDPGLRTVLQMPRGNLEGIHPRLICISKCIEFVENKQYGLAFKTLRQQKVDINLIYDVDPAAFLQNISLFVDQVSQVDYLNLFINSLVDEGVCQELEFMRPKDKEAEIREEHAQFMAKQIEGKKETLSSNKVNIVCEALKGELQARNQANQYLLPILTVYVKKQPQELKQVLNLIREMQQEQKKQNLQNRVIAPHLNPLTLKRDVDPNSVKLGAKEALEFVSWLVKPDKLFDVALTTYDFELVTLVATQTQKDPKEYVSYLQELKNIKDKSYMGYRIQLDLKDYESALHEICKAD
mmetsp:Transcript_12010/g.20268  ORF Transcript_12010/g.20268 Transcript_12010/m.20268 type:complete len:314 (-) Transcript_12010:1219-2160(-)